MLTIVWNPNEFHLIDVLPNGCKFNASYYMNKVLSEISEWREGQRGGATQRLVVHPLRNDECVGLSHLDGNLFQSIFDMCIA
jgi:hypothetical protein